MRDKIDDSFVTLIIIEKKGQKNIVNIWKDI